MIVALYSVFDAAACVYMPPFVARTDGEAKRMLQRSMDDRNSMIAIYPEQFRLLRIAHYDDADGAIVPIRPLELVCSGLDLRPPAEPGAV